MGHVLRHDGLLHEIIKGRMMGKSSTGRLQMLHEVKGDGYVTLK